MINAQSALKQENCHFDQHSKDCFKQEPSMEIKSREVWWGMGSLHDLKASSHRWPTSHREKISTDWRSWQHSPSWSTSLPLMQVKGGTTGLWIWCLRRHITSMGSGHTSSLDRIMRRCHTNPTSGIFYKRARPACFKNVNVMEDQEWLRNCPRFKEWRGLTTAWYSMWFSTVLWGTRGTTQQNQNRNRRLGKTPHQC